MDVDDDEQIGIVVLGTNGLAIELENKIKVRWHFTTFNFLATAFHVKFINLLVAGHNPLPNVWGTLIVRNLSGHTSVVYH